MMFNHPGHNLPPKIPCWIVGCILAVAVMDIHGCLDGQQTNNCHLHSQSTKERQCIRQCDQSPHIKYGNVTSWQPVGDQSPSQPHKLKKFTNKLKTLGWNTPLYNLTKNTNTFPFLVENDRVEHSSI